MCTLNVSCPSLKIEWLLAKARLSFQLERGAEAVQVGGQASNGSALVPPVPATPPLVGVSTAGVWTEHVARTVALTSPAKERALPTLCLCPPTSSHAFGFPDERWQAK